MSGKASWRGWCQLFRAGSSESWIGEGSEKIILEEGMAWAKEQAKMSRRWGRERGQGSLSGE